MAYVGYESRHVPRSARPARPPVAWGRLAVAAVSLLAWAGIIAALRAIF